MVGRGTVTEGSDLRLSAGLQRRKSQRDGEVRKRDVLLGEEDGWARVFSWELMNHRCQQTDPSWGRNSMV